MIEAVGHQYYDDYFRRCNALLAPGGRMCIQAITIADQLYENAKRSVDFIQRYIFPGSCIPSVTALCASMTRASELRLVGLDDIGLHYVRTLLEWRANLSRRADEARALTRSALLARGGDARSRPGHGTLQLGRVLVSVIACGLGVVDRSALDHRAVDRLRDAAAFLARVARAATGRSGVARRDRWSAFVPRRSPDGRDRAETGECADVDRAGDGVRDRDAVAVVACTTCSGSRADRTRALEARRERRDR